MYHWTAHESKVFLNSIEHSQIQVFTGQIVPYLPNYFRSTPPLLNSLEVNRIDCDVYMLCDLIKLTDYFAAC